MNLTLITGPVRSGKSRFGEQLATATGCSVTYVATAALDTGDLEWCSRIEHHRRRRPPQWKLIETAAEPGNELCDVLRHAERERVLLIDSLGTWLADRMTNARAALLAEPLALEAALERDCAALLTALVESPARTSILIGEETGWGIVPEHRSGRIFRDVLGRLHQVIAARADHVYLTVSGIALDLRSNGVPIADPIA